MQKKSEDFSIDQVKAFLKTPAGKELMTLLQRSNPAAIGQAVDAAKAGNYDAASDSVRKLLTPEMETLIRRMGGK